MKILQILIETYFEPRVLRNSSGLFSEACLNVSQLLPTSKKVTFGTKYSKMDQVKFVEDSL